MDLLADLLDHEPTAREVLRELIAADGLHIKRAEFNIYEVEVDDETGRFQVWDVLDASRPPYETTLTEAQHRLS